MVRKTAADVVPSLLQNMAGQSTAMECTIPLSLPYAAPGNLKRFPAQG